MPDSTTNNTPRQDILKAGNAFGYFGNYHPGIVTQETMNTGMDIAAIPITEKSLSTESVNFIEWVVAGQCEHPQKALAILNLLYTNADFQNLLDVYKRQVMEQAHLKKPSIMVIWEALIQKGLAADDGNYPATPQQAAQRIADCRNERGELI